MIKIKNIASFILLLSSSYSQAEYIEVIEVIADTVTVQQVDPVSVSTVSESVQPAMVYIPGGIGGFTGYGERGTQPNHTVVYRNGVPVNDSGAGWYDLGHDLATGNESATVVNGPQGVLYGTSSMGGTVFINDIIHESYLVKHGSRGSVISISPSNNINVTYADIDNGSVRTDNTEQDYYQQTGIRLQEHFFDDAVELNISFQDYDYDYDNCYTLDWQPSNQCYQEGNRVSVSARTENITVGYSSNNTEFFTVDDLTYETDSYNYFFDARKFVMTTSGFDLLFGTSYKQDNYGDLSQDFVEPYAFVSFNNMIDAGLRFTTGKVVGRLGVSFSDFYATVSTSFRQPTLYEQHGDGVWVLENLTLNPEEAVGYEVGYRSVSVYRYEFSEGIDYNTNISGYMNTGKYTSQGIRFIDNFDILDGKLMFMAGYTDTERARVPKYKMSAVYTKQFNDWQFNTQWVSQIDRGTEIYSDVELPDVNTLDIFVSKKFDNHTLSIGIEDVFDKSIEIVPGFSAGGQQFTLTWQYQ